MRLFIIPDPQKSATVTEADMTQHPSRQGWVNRTTHSAVTSGFFNQPLSPLLTRLLSGSQVTRSG